MPMLIRCRVKKEQWRPVVGREGLYEVSDLGRIKSLDRIVIRRNGIPNTVKGKLLKLNPDKDGYLSVTLYSSNPGAKVLPTKVHYIVIRAFTGPRPKGMLIRHLDDNPSNNKITNLAYGTKKDNTEDSIKNGTAAIGERNGRAKITQQDAEDVRAMYATGNYTQQQIGDIYDLDQSEVSRIIRHHHFPTVRGVICP